MAKAKTKAELEGENKKIERRNAFLRRKAEKLQTKNIELQENFESAEKAMTALEKRVATLATELEKEKVLSCEQEKTINLQKEKIEGQEKIIEIIEGYKETIDSLVQHI